MKPQKKVEMPNYTKEGYRSEHPVSRNQKDNKIRGEGDVGDFKHSMTRSGTPVKGYYAESIESNKRPSGDNKISGMPPIQHNVFGKPENGRGKGNMRNTDDCYNQSPKYAKSMTPGHGMVKAAGTK